jgi:hypothetical protein
MRKLVIITAALFGMSAVGMVIYVFPEIAMPFLFHRNSAPDVTDNKVRVVGKYELADWGSNLVSPIERSTIRTTLTIQCKSPISLDEGVDLAVTVDQELIIYNRRYFDSHREPITSADWPIHLELAGAGAFDFGTNEASRTLAMRTPLPQTLRWNPTPTKAGNWVLLLKLKDINGARGKFNSLFDKGNANDEVEVLQPHSRSIIYGGSADIPLSITVWTEYGIPVRVVTWAALTWGIAFAILGSIGGLGTIFRWFRRSRPRHAVEIPPRHKS